MGKIIAGIYLALLAVGAVAQTAQPLPSVMDDLVPAEWTLPKQDPYPGVNQAVVQTLAQQSSRAHLAEGPMWTDDEAKPVCYDRWVYVGGFSHHNTGGKTNTNHEQNFGLGGAVSAYCEMWIHPVAQMMHVFVNSRKGTTDMKALGLEACLRTDDLDFCYSRSRVYARVTDGKGRAAAGWLPQSLPSISLGKGRWRIYLTPLDKNVYYVFLGIGF